MAGEVHGYVLRWAGLVEHESGVAARIDTDDGIIDVGAIASLQKILRYFETWEGTDVDLKKADGCNPAAAPVVGNGRGAPQ